MAGIKELSDECASCGSPLKSPDWEVLTAETCFCLTCWESMTPFERGLLRTIINGCREIVWAMEERISEITSAIEGNHQ